MLPHLITAPVFNALFENHDFITHNPVASDGKDTRSPREPDTETESLEKFYDSRVRARKSQALPVSSR